MLDRGVTVLTGIGTYDSSKSRTTTPRSGRSRSVLPLRVVSRTRGSRTRKQAAEAIAIDRPTQRARSTVPRFINQSATMIGIKR